MQDKIVTEFYIFSDIIVTFFQSDEQGYKILGTQNAKNQIKINTKSF